MLDTSRLVVVSAFGKKMETDAAVTMDWKDLPAELLLRILSLVDSNGAMQIEVVASCVCTGWRNAIGLTNLSLSWYTLWLYLFDMLATLFTELTGQVGKYYDGSY